MTRAIVAADLDFASGLRRASGNGGVLTGADLTGLGVTFARGRPLNMGGFGDSRKNQSIGDSGRSLNFRSTDCWVDIHSDGRVIHDPTMNFGVSGYSTADVIANIDTYIAAWVANKVDAVDCWLLTNDPGNGILPAQSAANCATIIQKVRNAGILLFWWVELPRGYLGTAFPYPTGFTTFPPEAEPLLAYHYANIATSQLFSNNAGVFLVDASKYVYDPSRTDGSPIQDRYLDGLHPSQRASYLFGLAFRDVIVPLIPNIPPFLVQSNSAYNKANNPYGNYIVNGMVQGTAGTIGTNCIAGSSGSGITPGLCDSFTISSNDANFVGAVSKVVETDAVSGAVTEWQRVVVSSPGVTTNANPIITITRTATNLTPPPADGTYIGIGMRARWAAGVSRMRGVQLRVTGTDSVGGNTYFSALGAIPSDFGDMLSVACPERTWSAKGMKVPVGGTPNPSWQLQLYGRQGYADHAFQFDFRQATLCTRQIQY